MFGKEIKISITVNKASSSTPTIKLSKTSYVYNGNARTPVVTVYDSNGKKISSSNYTVSYKNNKKVGNAYLIVKFKGEYAENGTLAKVFSITPKSTSISKLTAKSKGFSITLKKVTTQTTGYQIQYATNSKFTSGKVTKTISSSKTTTKTITGLKAKKKYYVRVRTYKTVNGQKCCSEWSAVKTVTTK